MNEFTSPPTPKISVNMIVYNGEEFLEEAICSILNQSFTDFEFIIVDDASTDNTANILTQFASKDSRIHIITNKENSGRPISRNKALHAAQAPYIIVMDADDWAYPELFAIQYKFMEDNPQVSLCGCSMEIYETGELLYVNIPTSNVEIRTALPWQNFLTHSAMIMRKKHIFKHVQGYDESFACAQDHALWARLWEHDDIVFANHSDALVRYRMHPNTSRLEYYEKQIENSCKIMYRMQKQLSIRERLSKKNATLTIKIYIRNVLPRNVHFFIKRTLKYFKII